jgi:hypothetical protein
MGRRFELRIDHNSLKYLFDQPTLNARQSRWLEFIFEYDFDIKHIKGKENKVVDALSMRVMNYMLQPLACTKLILKEEFWRPKIQICSTGIR